MKCAKQRLNGSTAPGLLAVRGAAHQEAPLVVALQHPPDLLASSRHLGSGRIVASETEVPIILVSLVWSG